jgi:hypothetical protein
MSLAADTRLPQELIHIIIDLVLLDEASPLAGMSLAQRMVQPDIQGMGAKVPTIPLPPPIFALL